MIYCFVDYKTQYGVIELLSNHVLDTGKKNKYKSNTFLKNKIKTFDNGHFLMVFFLFRIILFQDSPFFFIIIVKYKKCNTLI